MSKLNSMLSLLLISGGCHGLEGTYNIDAYAGAEPTIRNMEFKKNFGSGVFNDPFYTSINVFIGCKVNQNFGIEAGYELSETKLQSKNDKMDHSLFGNRLMDETVGFDSLHNFIHSNSKISGFNINFMGFFPLNINKTLNMIGSAGLSHLRSATSCELFELGESNIELYNQTVPVQKFVSTRSRYKNRTVTLRFKAGFQYLTDRNFGIRALASWENTHKIKIQGKDRDTGKKLNEHAKFKDSITYSIGFFVPF